jgi:hypothetical protein
VRILGISQFFMGVNFVDCCKSAEFTAPIGGDRESRCNPFPYLHLKNLIFMNGSV